MSSRNELFERLRESPLALAAAILAVLGVAVAVLVSQIGLPPGEALFPTGIAFIVLLFVAWDWLRR